MFCGIRRFWQQVVDVFWERINLDGFASGVYLVRVIDGGEEGRFEGCGWEVGASVDVRMCGFADVRMCGFADGWMCGFADVRMGGCADLWMGGCVDVWICGCVDLRISGCVDKWML